jgi:hypothetical protein
MLAFVYLQFQKSLRHIAHISDSSPCKSAVAIELTTYVAHMPLESNVTKLKAIQKNKTKETQREQKLYRAD